jgi:SPX domain protein involved in polyphosphate accumulation
MMIPVEGHKNLFRDENTGAILNCDSFAYQNYINTRNEKKKQKNEIEKLKNEVSEIKSLLLQLINESK